MLEEKRWLIYFKTRFYTEKIESWNDSWCRPDKPVYVDRKEEERCQILLSAETDKEAVKEAREKLASIKEPLSKSSYSCSYIHVEKTSDYNYDIDLDTGERFKTAEEAKGGGIFMEGGRRFMMGGRECGYP